MIEKKVDVKKHRFPYSVVWTPLPILTWCIPCIGHTGIGDVQGIIHDFSGSQTISIDEMAFGWPTKYVQLRDLPDSFDDALLVADREFQKRDHQLISNNCHDHVAYALNECNYKNKRWSPCKVACLLICKGKYTSFGGWVQSNLPCLICLVLAFVITSLFIFLD